MKASLEALVELLFKYRPVVFERGELSLGLPAGMRLIVLVLGAIALLGAAGLLTRRVRGRPRDRAVIGALRLSAVMLLVLCLLQPQIVVAESATRGNVVAVLVDESRSMLLPDAGGRTRADAVREMLAGQEGLLSALGSRFQLRLYGYGAALRRSGTPSDLRFDSPRSSIASALDGVARELDGQPLAGVVLVSDGGDQAGGTLSGAISALRARRVPVFTVLADGEPAVDVTVAAVEVPQSAVRGSAVDARVTLAHRGMGGRSVTVVAEDEGRVVAVREVTLPRAGRATVALPVPMREEGTRRLRFRVTQETGDQVSPNDERLALVRVDSRPRRILYFEGEPRPEAKFVRQAVAGDRELQVVLLQRTADEKFLRLGVTDSVELGSGFPGSRELLFGYDAIVLGSVEASAFSYEQLRMLEDFVDVRGGGLLLLGGRRALGEGGFAGTPVAALSPVSIVDMGVSHVVDTVQPRLTSAGSEHAAMQLGDSAGSMEEHWRRMPSVTVVNRVGSAKPGAVTLLSGPDGQTPLLAYQRFGAGRTAILLAQDSWIWQMHADIPLEDGTHEQFWRQLLRWLAGDSPGRVTGSVARATSEPGEQVELRVATRDARFSPEPAAVVTATVITPSGNAKETLLQPDGMGGFTGTVEPDESGLWQVRITAVGSDGEARTDELAFSVEHSRDEYYDVAPRREALSRLAAMTGGRAYDLAGVGSLSRDIVYSSGGVTTQERKDLWDSPAILLALLSVLSAEWAFRRWRGMA